MVIYINVDAMINDIIETTNDDVLIKARVKERGMPIKQLFISVIGGAIEGTRSEEGGTEERIS